MGLLGKLWVKLGLDSSEYQKGTKDAEKTTESFGDKIKGVVAKAAAAIGVLTLLKKAFNFGKEAYNTAAQAEGVERAFARLNNPNLLNDLRAATQGTVSDLELMQNAIQAKNFKIPLENLATYLKFAKQRADETGQSVDYLVQSIVLGVGRKSPLILDNLGISALETREEFAKTGDMAKAVANIIEREMGASNSTVATSKVLAEQAGAAWKNVMGEIGKTSVIKGLGDWFSKASAAIAENLQRIIPIVRDVIVGYVAYKTTVIALSIAEKARLIATLSGEAAMSIATRGVTYWKGIQYTLTLNLKKAQEALNIAMAKNPYGLIAMGIATAVFAISRLISAIGEETKAERELREEQERKQQRNNGYLQSMAKEQIQVDILFGKLKSLKVGTSEYNDVKETIISRYGQYLKGLGEEITSLRNVEAAYKAISTAAVQAARDRALESATSEAADKYAKVEAENLVDIRRLILEFNKGVGGEAIFESLKQSIRLGEEFTDEVKKAIGYTADWMSETTVVAGSIIKRVPNVYELLIKNIQSSKKELDTETKEIEVILGGIFNAKAGKTYTKISELMTSLMQYQSELNNLNNKTSWSEEEEGRIGELNTSIDELKTKYKTLTGKEWGAKVKVETDKDKTKNALEGSIAYFENLLSKAQLELKIAVTDEQRTKAQADIKKTQAEIDVRVNVPKSERQVIEDAIKGYEDLRLAIPIGMGSPEEMTAAQAEWDRLTGIIKQAREEQSKFAKEYEAGSETDLSNQIADQEKLLKNSKLTAERYAEIKTNLDKLKASMDALPQNVLPEGSLAQIEEGISKLNKEFDNASTSQDRAAISAKKLGLEWKKMQIEVESAKKTISPVGGYTGVVLDPGIEKQIDSYKALAETFRDLNPVIAKSFRTLVHQLELTREVALDFEKAIEDSLYNTFETLFQSLASMSEDQGFNSQAVVDAMLSPFIMMMEELSKYLISTGVAMEAVRIGFASLGGVGMIAAGIALAAVVGAAKGGISKIPNGSKSSSNQSSNSNTFTGGYSNGGGGGRSAQSLQLASPQRMEVVVTGEINAGGMRVALLKEEQRRSR